MKAFKWSINKSLVLVIMCALFSASFRPYIAKANDIDVLSNEERSNNFLTGNSVGDANEDSGLTLISVVSKPKSNISIMSTTQPGDSSKWNLSNDNLYHYYVDSHGNDIYSNYVFTGHGGRVRLMGTENGGKTGTYYIKFYISDAFFDTCYTYSAQRGTTFYQTFTCNSSDLIYFSICPNNDYVYVAGTLITY